MTALSQIRCESFKSFTKAQLDVAELPVGLHLVRGRNLLNPGLGSNGSGKSTFFADAPTWCLYGQTIGGLRTTDVQPWGSKKAAAKASVELTDSEGTTHAVSRGPRTSELLVDDKLVGQPEVDALVGLDLNAWSQAVVWGQNAPFFYDLTPAAKMALLSSALGLERWDRRAEAAGKRARRLEARRSEVEGEARGLEAAAEHARDSLRTAREAASRWGLEHARRAEAAAAALVSARGRAGELEIRRGEAALEAERVGLDLRAAQEDADAARAEVTRLQAAASAARAASLSAMGDLGAAKERLKQLEAYPGECPECGQSVPRAHVRAKAKAQAAAVKELARAHREARELAEAADAALAEAEGKTGEVARKRRAAEEALRGAEGRQHLLERELAAARATEAAAEREAAAVEGEENPHREAAQAARARLREVEADVRAKSILAERLGASAERAKFWARGFREIRLGIVEDLLAELADATADVLDRLSMGEWAVEYLTERETKSGTQRALLVVVRAPGAPAGGVRWESYSGGERQRLRLAGTVALSEVLLARAGASVDFRVLDEPTRGLSAEGVQELVEVLADYAEQAGLKIFFIDHAAVDSDRFASTTTVESGAGGARLSATTPSGGGRSSRPTRGGRR